MKSLRYLWYLLLLPWKVMFAFVPPYQIAHGWISFICSLMFISGIAYIVTKITDMISCVTGSFQNWNLIFFFLKFWNPQPIFSDEMKSSFLNPDHFPCRTKRVCYCFYCIGCGNFLARFSCKQDRCSASDNS